MKTLTAILLLISLQSYADESELCLTQAIYFEARGESIEGMFAVAEVIMSRVSNWKYPNSVCGVTRQTKSNVYYRCQFSYWCDYRSDWPDNTGPSMRSWRLAGTIAKAFLAGDTYLPVEGYTVYVRCDSIPNYWDMSKLTGDKVIGDHCFYEEM
jgi:spore germination cell wall hydrolase CwlJ-like protein